MKRAVVTAEATLVSGSRCKMVAENKKSMVKKGRLDGEGRDKTCPTERRLV